MRAQVRQDLYGSLYLSDLLYPSARTDFVITTSVDGHVKLWKKQADSVEFVKHYRASLNSIVAVSADHEGKVFATVSEGGEGRVFDVVNFGKLSTHQTIYTVGSALTLFIQT